ncbi:MAG: hypothetical protein ACI9FN_001233 [Saprospiraceae bacterium]|jgi:hypothetical protein
MVESLILHPALLVAKGFESLDTSDMRFLQAYRNHFEEAKEMHRTRVYRPQDFLLGGILNPGSEYFDINEAYAEACDRIDSFPYMTLYEIRMHFYYGRIASIFDGLCLELHRELEMYAQQYQKSLVSFTDTPTAIRQLERTSIYSKIRALHQCGLGNKKSKAFQFIIEGFISMQRSKEVQKVNR